MKAREKLEELRVLLVEDDEDDYILAGGMLEKIDTWRLHVEWCPDYDSALAVLARNGADVALLDYHLGARSGLELLRDARTQGCVIPIVMLTGSGGYDVDMKAMTAGAADYLCKDTLGVQLLERSLRYTLDRAATLALVKRSHDDMLAVLNQMDVGSAAVDENGTVTFLNATCERVLGVALENLADRHWKKVFPLERKYRERLQRTMAAPASDRGRVHMYLQSTAGAPYWLDIEVRDDPRDPQGKILFMYDVSEVHALRQELDKKASFHDLIGRCKAMRDVFRLIEDMSKVEVTVLIEGETGTGKELVARALHASSSRRKQPFVPVNCAGLADSLLHSQLFGHKRGAFTGAIEDQAGVFEAADGGTVFLDEIGDISSSVQTALLRVLQEKEITRLGDVRPRKVDVRIVAATHRDLQHEVESGRFRHDLLYRIRVAPIALPPLSSRRTDIPLLVTTFLRRICAATGATVETCSQDAMNVLMNYSWPGNVRELLSAIEFGVIRSRGNVLEPGALPPEVLAQGSGAGPQSVEFERQRIIEALQSASGNRALAARNLGIGRATLYRRLAELEINDVPKREASR
ncbi:MAG: sigma 54-interacting transcriptional regulator [Planctomycetota bacterium]|jgi:PAS domain S-box-containing protein